MKKFFTTLITLVLFSVSLFSQATKSIVQTFNFDNTTTLSTELYGDVTIQKWQNNYVRVEVSVTLENFTQYTLNNLYEAGRYKLLSDYKGSNLHIYNIPTQYRIKINGSELKEIFSYRVFVPNSTDDNEIHIIFPVSQQYTPNLLNNQKPIN